MDDTQKLMRLERAITAMPRITREVFLAHRLDGYSYAEIAAITGLSIRQVEKHIAKAIGHLGCHLRGDEPTGWQRFRARIARRL